MQSKINILLVLFGAPILGGDYLSLGSASLNIEQGDIQQLQGRTQFTDEIDTSGDPIVVNRKCVELACAKRDGVDGDKDLESARRLFAGVLYTPYGGSADPIDVNRARLELARMLRKGEGGDKDSESARSLFDEVIKGFSDDTDIDIRREVY